MSLACTLPHIGSRLKVKNFHGVNIVPVLEYKLRPCHIQRVETSTPVSMFKHLSNVIDFVRRLKFIIYVLNIKPFRNTSGMIVTGIHSLN